MDTYRPVLPDNPIRQILGTSRLLACDDIHRKIDCARGSAKVKTHRRPVEQFDEGLRQNVLTRMLLHVIAPPLRIDDAVHGRNVEAFRHHMNDSTGGSVLGDVNHRNAVQCAEIVWLPPARGVKSSPVEKNAEAFLKRNPVKNASIELQK